MSKRLISLITSIIIQPWSGMVGWMDGTKALSLSPRNSPYKGRAGVEYELLGGTELQSQQAQVLFSNRNASQL